MITEHTHLKGGLMDGHSDTYMQTPTDEQTDRQPVNLNL